MTGAAELVPLLGLLLRREKELERAGLANGGSGQFEVGDEAEVTGGDLGGQRGRVVLVGLLGADLVEGGSRDVGAFLRQSAIYRAVTILVGGGGDGRCHSETEEGKEGKELHDGRKRFGIVEW